MQRKLLGIISVNSDAAVQLLIIYSAFAGYLRKLHNGYYSGDQIKNEMGGPCSTYTDRRGAYSVLVRKLKNETTWKTQALMGSIIKIDLQEVGWGGQ